MGFWPPFAAESPESVDDIVGYRETEVEEGRATRYVYK